MKILIVEDDESIRELVSTALLDAGHEVEVAANGAAGLVALEHAHPDAFVVDINMPEMDGLSFLEAVRARPDFAQSPTLMLTAQSAPEDIRRSLQLGAADFIGKPFDMRLLLRRLERMLHDAHQ